MKRYDDDGDDGQSVVSRARALADDGHPADARALLAEHLASAPDDDDAADLLAALNAEAEDAAAAAAEESPLARALNRAQELADEERWPEARAVLEEQLAAGADDDARLELQRMLARVLEHIDLDAALALLDELSDALTRRRPSGGLVSAIAWAGILLRHPTPAVRGRAADAMLRAGEPESAIGLWLDIAGAELAGPAPDPGRALAYVERAGATKLRWPETSGAFVDALRAAREPLAAGDVAAAAPALSHARQQLRQLRKPARQRAAPPSATTLIMNGELAQGLPLLEAEVAAGARLRDAAFLASAYEAAGRAEDAVRVLQERLFPLLDAAKRPLSAAKVLARMVRLAPDAVRRRQLAERYAELGLVSDACRHLALIGTDEALARADALDRDFVWRQRLGALLGEIMPVLADPWIANDAINDGHYDDAILYVESAAARGAPLELGPTSSFVAALEGHARNGNASRAIDAADRASCDAWERERDGTDCWLFLTGGPFGALAARDARIRALEAESQTYDWSAMSAEHLRDHWRMNRAMDALFAGTRKPQDVAGELFGGGGLFGAGADEDGDEGDAQPADRRPPPSTDPRVGGPAGHAAVARALWIEGERRREVAPLSSAALAERRRAVGDVVGLLAQGDNGSGPLRAALDGLLKVDPSDPIAAAVRAILR